MQFLFHFNLLQPPRLISPATQLKERRGNSFEMATLLCSLLIANRYGAMVASGYASREITNNDQQRVAYPNIPKRSSHQQESKVWKKPFFANVCEKNSIFVIFMTLFLALFCFIIEGIDDR